MLKTLLLSLFSAITNGINSWLRDRRVEENTKRLGALELTTLAQKEALERAKMQKTKEAVINSLDNDALTKRMLATRERIRASRDSDKGN